MSTASKPAAKPTKAARGTSASHWLAVLLAFLSGLAMWVHLMMVGRAGAA